MEGGGKSSVCGGASREEPVRGKRGRGVVRGGNKNHRMDEIVLLKKGSRGVHTEISQETLGGGTLVGGNTQTSG